MLSFILIVVGIVMLIKCADMFVDGCSNVAKSFGIPSLIIGLTIVAFGTSAPEASVSVSASLKGMNDISLGNVVGSNICNLLLILGTAGMFGTLTAKRKIVTRDFVYSIIASVALFVIGFSYFAFGKSVGMITRTNGMLLLCFLAFYLFALLSEAIRSSREKEEKVKFSFKDIIFIIVGIIGIILGGQLVVNSAVEIATMFNISQNVIALTIVAIGTSLPELVTSVVATRKGEVDIAIGNVVGSNIFNIFFILGMSSVISPISFGISSFIDIVIMLISTIVVYLFLLKNMRIGNKKGIVLLGMYVLYMVYILMR